MLLTGPELSRGVDAANPVVSVAACGVGQQSEDMGNHTRSTWVFSGRIVTVLESLQRHGHCDGARTATNHALSSCANLTLHQLKLSDLSVKRDSRGLSLQVFVITSRGVLSAKRRLRSKADA